MCVCKWINIIYIYYIVFINANATESENVTQNNKKNNKTIQI